MCTSNRPLILFQALNANIDQLNLIDNKDDSQLCKRNILDSDASDYGRAMESTTRRVNVLYMVKFFALNGSRGSER